MALNQQGVRNVGARQVYESYMAILRISPNDYTNSWLDDTTLPFRTLKDSGNVDHKIILSDSDGNRLGLCFIPRVRRMRVQNANGSYVNNQEVINCTLKPDSADGETFITTSLHIRSTAIFGKERRTDRISPLQVFEKNNKFTDSYNLLLYPIESPNDDSYFNAKNKHSLVNYNSSVPLQDQLEASLKKKPLSWFTNTSNVAASEIVKIDGKVVYTTNDNFEEVPVLYTRDYVLGHYSGHTTYVTSDVLTEFAGALSTPNKTAENQTVATRLSFLRLDKMVWNKVAQIVSGEKRHTVGRYSQLGADESESICGELFGTVSPPQSTSPLIGVSVPDGMICYNAMPIHRFLFHCARNEIFNIKCETTAGTISNSYYNTCVNAGKITSAYSSDPGVGSKLVRSYALCDGKELTYDNYKALSVKNANLYSLNDNGSVKRASGTTGKPTQATPTGFFKAMLDSNPNKAKLKMPETPDLLSFSNVAMRYLRGLNWLTTIGVDKPINPRTDYSEDMFKDCNYKIEVVPGETTGAVEKNLKDVGSYRTMYDFRIRNVDHKHYCFSSQKGEPFWPNKQDPMYVEPGLVECSFRLFHRTYKFFVEMDVNFTLERELWEEDLMKVGTGRFWRHLFTYSFTDVRNEKDNFKQTQAYLYGATPVRTAGLHAWKVTKDSNGNEGLTNNFEEQVSAGEYFIQNSELTPIAVNKTQRRKQLYALNMAEAKAPISIMGRGGETYSERRVSAKCRKGSRFHHTHDGHYAKVWTGGYQLMAYDPEMADNYEFVARFVTSLPHAETSSMGEVSETKDTTDVTIGDKTVPFDNTLPEPPSLNFLPLLKV